MGVAGGWLPIHTTWAIDPYARGQEFGLSARRIRRTVREYPRHFAASGIASATPIKVGSMRGPRNEA
jgi:hypothetical protein